jgi:hypothetical protein
MRGRSLRVAWEDEEEILREAYRPERDGELRPRLHVLRVEVRYEWRYLALAASA